MSKGVRRREFIGSAVAMAAGLTVHRARAADPGRTLVVVVHRPGVAALKGDERRAVLQPMLDAGLAQLCGKSGAAAWAEYVRPEDVVAIKVNTIAAQTATSPDLADLVARGVMAAGVPGERVRVYDRFERELERAGYTLGVNPAGYRVVSTDHAELGYDPRTHRSGRVEQRITRVLTQSTTALINLPVLKDHNVCGVTGALKNHFGSIDNPQKLHEQQASPHVAEVNCFPPIRNAHRLVIGDALWVVYEGGPTSNPRFRFAADSLLLATDPVAHDQIAYGLLDGIRKQRGLPPLARVGREPGYLKAAAAPPRSLGVCDPARIDVKRIEVA
ncbi:MAG: DUF362 domain-containing protein [Armatimonadetes bacterium]|nr:DUF362 domain-containing protein [Armatimonadota bacterium]